MSKELRVAIEAAKSASELQLNRLRTKLNVKSKSPKDFVTDVDAESNEIICGKIKENFPQHTILSEESKSPSEVREFKWIIDPLDGTVCYMTGLPTFGISIALEKKGGLVAGVISLPCLREMLSAEKGKGAFINGEKISVSNKKSLEVATGIIEMEPGKRAWQEYSGLFGSLFGKLRNMQSFPSAFGLSMVASGRADFFVTANSHSWDCAAGSLIIEEAGGTLTDFQGKSGPYISAVAASNGLLHKALLQELNK
jgi:myo-inositol-1(or 4)-monophosphatase